MSGFNRALWGLGLAGLLGGVIIYVLGDQAEHSMEPELTLFGPIIAWSFIGAGLYAWRRQPENRTGSLMVAIGFAWLIASLLVTDQPLLHIVGMSAYALPYALLLHMLVAFPSGTVEGRLERFAVGLAYVVTIVFTAGLIPFWDTARHDCDGCPHNPLLITRSDGAVHALQSAQAIVSIAGLLLITYLLVRRFRESTGSRREAVAHVGGVAAMLFASLIVTLFADVVDLGSRVEDVVDRAAQIFMTAIPFAFLAALLRGRYARALAVSDLVRRAAAPRRDLRAELAGALADPGLRLAYWIADREHFVDAHGRPMQLPGHAVVVEGVGAIVSTADPELVRDVAAAAALAMENERLEAELHANIEELRESRTRIVRAADDERRRLERDLHDGAQQRLVALSLTLRLARAKASGEAAELLDAAAAELAQATAELRELARGIHPAVLTDRGLAPAVDALAARAPVPVEVEGVPQERLPAGVEAAAYFLVAEALTNVSRYSGAGHAEVRMARENGTLVVEVRDDGVGGADPAAGSGLRGLADRVAALDGRLEVRSPRGGGTVVRAEVPCAS